MKYVISNLLFWDLRIFFLLSREMEARFLSRFFSLISKSADGLFYPLIAILIWISNPAIGKSFLVAAIIAFAIELPLYWLIKNSVKRNRPFQSLEGVTQRIKPPDQFSFPSGHTAAAVVMTILITHYFPGLSWVFWSWSALTGVSRVYLAVHYPTDVFAGAVLGLISASVGLHFA